MNQEDQDFVERLLRELWPTASPERCASTTAHLAHYPVEGVTNVIHQNHGQSTLMPEVEILREVKLRYPAIAQEVAARQRQEQLATNTSIVRTEKEIGSWRGEAAQRAKYWQAIDERISTLSETELASLASPAIDALVASARANRPGVTEDDLSDLEALYRRRNPRHNREIKRAIVELLDSGFRPPLQEGEGPDFEAGTAATVSLVAALDRASSP